MTHEERVWELFKGFINTDFLQVHFYTKEYEEFDKHSKLLYKTADDYATAFEELSKRRADHGTE